MINDSVASALAGFGLTPRQHEAAVERERDVIVTAGAGCGKTRTLVARYVSLLAEGWSPRSLLAVTFTEKAAREMRSRVRAAVVKLSTDAVNDDERHTWEARAFALDAARIGTIHSLCAEILRAHPAEAAVDPRFEVLDEANTSLLRARVVEDTLAQLVDCEAFAPLLRALKADSLQRLLGSMLEQRLDAYELRLAEPAPLVVIGARIRRLLEHESFKDAIEELRAMSPAQLLDDAGEKLAAQVKGLLADWAAMQSALESGDLFTGLRHLHRARRAGMAGNVGSNRAAKGIVKQLRETYDRLLDPLVGGSKNTSEPPNAENEVAFIEAQTLAWRAFDVLLPAYQAALRGIQALDFDDLEDRAHRLLTSNAAVRRRWQQEFTAILVDEFQDTNHRQREIIEALAGVPGQLFIVGDARQSIYRFRRADVTVFREILERIRAEGGLVVDLNETYRTHAPLLEAAGDLLAAVMGEEEVPGQRYVVPFTRLSAQRLQPPGNIRAPHIEMVLGIGANAEEGRPAAARLLAQRLLELRAEGQIRAWDEVALLFRASRAFRYYEDAFEFAGIPFVTVAGRGMYDRPEIRDVLNILHALADPADDNAVAGMLRSPAFGLSDTALYHLRFTGGHPRPYYQALHADLSMLASEDCARALNAARVFDILLEQVDRVPVAALLQELVALTDYRAILAVDDQSGSQGRLWRNLDKLLDDARASEQVLVRDFLDYLGSLDEVSAREGEAPIEALGAVRLMSIHRAKGLEFPVVVLADAAYHRQGVDKSPLLLPGLGLSFKLETPSLYHHLVEQEDKLQDEAETDRLLYVALTRAQNKLIISGHLSQNESGTVSTDGWLKELCIAAGIDDLAEIVSCAGRPATYHTAAGHPLCVLAATQPDAAPAKPEPAAAAVEESPAAPLYAPLPEPAPKARDDDQVEEDRLWRAAGRASEVPATALGRMVHLAIECWLFPGDARLEPLLRGAALSAGLVMPAQQDAAIRQAVTLLARLRAHPLSAEIDNALERRHEVPYTLEERGRSDYGFIDILYRTVEGWQVVDFKTDALRSQSDKESRMGAYSGQMRRYAAAASGLLQTRVRLRLCLLDDRGAITLIPFE